MQYPYRQVDLLEWRWILFPSVWWLCIVPLLNSTSQIKQKSRRTSSSENMLYTHIYIYICIIYIYIFTYHWLPFPDPKIQHLRYISVLHQLQNLRSHWPTECLLRGLHDRADRLHLPAIQWVAPGLGGITWWWWWWCESTVLNKSYRVELEFIDFLHSLGCQTVPTTICHYPISNNSPSS